MRRIILHRRATRYLRRMPRDRQAQMVASLEEIAALPDITAHPGIRKLTGQDGWFRLRVGVYRAILQPKENGEVEVLFVDYIGPRGDAYRSS
jgi:mRNA-degrading endonuclease RelE of RelBE toxin-antitoxin system